MSHSTNPRLLEALAGLLIMSISGCGAARQFAVQHQSESFAPELRLRSGDSAAANQISAVPSQTEDGSNIDQVDFEDPSTLQLPPAPDASASEAAPAGTDWTLSRLEALALQNNAAIQQATASAHKSMGYRDQVGRHPNPTIGYQATQLADAGTDQHVAFVEQDFVLGDKLVRNQNVLGKDVQVQLWEVEIQRYRVLTDVRQLYYVVLATQLKRDLAVEYQRKARGWRSQADERNAAGEGNKLETGQSAILSKQFQLLERQADAELRGAWKQLMATTGSPGHPVERLSGELSQADDRDLGMISARILADSPEIQAARARCARAQANLDRQQAQAIPNLSLMLAAGRDNGTGSGMVNAQVGMPIPVHNRNQGNIAAAYAEVCRASQNVRRLELSLQARIAETQQQWEAALAAVQQYRDNIIPQAEETLALMEQGLRTEGNVTFVEVLVARKTAFDAHWEFVSAQAKLANAGAVLDGMILTGGLDETRDTDMDSALRDQSLSGQ